MKRVSTQPHISLVRVSCVGAMSDTHLSGAVSADDDAFDVFFRREYPVMVSLVVALTGDRELTRDGNAEIVVSGTTADDSAPTPAPARPAEIPRPLYVL
jgi:hypothetical protein